MNVLLLAAAFVSLLSWSPSGADSRDPTTAGSRMLAPGLENGVLRAAPAVARAEELDRSLDRRSFPPPSALVPLTALALGLIVSAIAPEGRSAAGGHLASVLGSRAPPSLRLRSAHRLA
jgi:hypothetical protein